MNDIRGGCLTSYIGRLSHTAARLHSRPQSHYRESGNCVQIICANEGVHPISFGPTSVQFESEINGAFSCKRHQKQHLEFLTAFLRTRRPGVRIPPGRTTFPWPIILDQRPLSTSPSVALRALFLRFPLTLYIGLLYTGIRWWH
jgi:hypothetical protein